MQDTTFERAKEIKEEIEEIEDFLGIYDTYNISSMSLVETALNRNTTLVLPVDVIPSIIQLIQDKLEILNAEFEEL